MSITTTDRKAGPFLGDGVTTEFPFDFVVYAKAHLRVVVANAQGERELTVDSDYDVELNANQADNPGGLIRYPRPGSSGTPLQNGEILVITTAAPAVQTAEFTSMGGFYPQTVEQRLDYLTVLVQQLEERMKRVPEAGITDTANLSLGTAAQRAKRFLGFNEDGDAVFAATPAVDPDFQDQLDKLVLDGPIVDATSFGATPGVDNPAARRAALQLAIDSTAGKNVLLIPAGVWEIDGALQWRSGSVIRGAGIGRTIIKLSDAAPEDANIFEPVAKDGTIINWRISDMTLDGNYARPTVSGVGTERPGASCIATMGASYGTIERVHAKDAVLHCFDICNGGEIDGGRRYYIKPENQTASYFPDNPSRFVVVRDCIGENAGDDAFTTHWCEHVWIENCVARDAGLRQITPYACNGIEVDDGSRNVWVSRCHAYNVVRGFAAKTHPPFAAPVRVHFTDCVADGCNTGFYIHKSGTSTVGAAVYLTNPVVRNPAEVVDQTDAPLHGIHVVNALSTFITNPYIEAPAESALPLDQAIFASTSAKLVKIMGGHIVNWPRHEDTVRANAAITATSTVQEIHVLGVTIENCGWRGLVFSHDGAGIIRIRDVHCIGEDIPDSVGLLFLNDAPTNLDLEVSGFTAKGYTLATSYGRYDSVSGSDVRHTNELAFGRVNVQNGSYTFTADDVGGLVAGNTGDNPTYTIPEHSAVPIPQGASIFVSRSSTGTTTIVPDSGVSLTVAGMSGTANNGISIGGGKFNLIELRKLHAANLWIAFGNDITVIS